MTRNASHIRVANRAGRPTKADLERRKAVIFKVAERLFIEEGFAATTLEAIARQAGVATRTLYHHYGDKAALFRIVVQERTGRLGLPDDVNDPAPAGRLLDSRQVLRVAASRLLDICLSPETIAIERMMIAEMRRFPDMAQSIVAPNVALLQSQLAELLRAMEQRRVIPPVDHEVAAKYFIDLIVGMASLHLLVGYAEAIPDPDEIERKIDLFLTGLGALKHSLAQRSNRPLRHRSSLPRAEGPQLQRFPPAD